MLADKMKHHEADAWLINTGWNGGAYGVGKRISLKYSRAIIDAIHDGSLKKVSYEKYPLFNLQIPTSCPNVPAEILNPSKTWMGEKASYEKTLTKLATLFQENFKIYQDKATPEIVAAGPVL
jgi:phosphoenolpyruvate carboxykinase (ATP)